MGQGDDGSRQAEAGRGDALAAPAGVQRPVPVWDDERDDAQPGDAPAPRRWRLPAWATGPRRLGPALAVSLLVHGLLASLSFSGLDASGLPSLQFLWDERRVQAPPLRVRLDADPSAVVAAADAAAQPAAAPREAPPCPPR